MDSNIVSAKRVTSDLPAPVRVTSTPTIDSRRVCRLTGERESATGNGTLRQRGISTTPLPTSIAFAPGVFVIAGRFVAVSCGAWPGNPPRGVVRTT